MAAVAASTTAAAALCASLLAPGVATAAGPDDALIADFTFDSGTTSFTGAGATATTQGTARLVPGVVGNAAQLGSGFWLNVAKTGGAPLLAGLDDVTISYDSKPASSGNTGWSVFAARSAATQAYAQEHYLGFLDRTTGVTVERYDNAGSRNSSGNLVSTAATTEWKHVDLVISGATARLFVDKKLVSTNSTGPALSKILGSTGGVLQVGKANWGGGEYFSGLLDNLRIYNRALTPSELGLATAASDPAAALSIPARITGDLPSSVLGSAVTWSASGAGASLVSADGKVTRPASGPVAVELTATIAGVTTPVTASAQILDAGGDVATYVKTVTTTNGVKDDPLAYNDDRRADALFVSARPSGASTWEPLNRSQAILYATWNGSQTANPNAQVGSPTLVRFADGTLGAVAAQNNATDSVYVWDAPDGATFRNQRTVKIASDGSIVKNPRIEYDAASQKYKAYWTDELTGEGRVARLDSLTAASTPTAATKADVRTLGVAGAGLPGFTAQAQASSFALSKAEFDVFYKNYVYLQNTGVRAPADVQVENGKKVDATTLPGSVTLDYNDGSTKNLPVTWDAEDLASIDSRTPGTYEVTGLVQQTAEEMVNDARADPHLFFNEDDGFWYLTGSHYSIPSNAPNDQLIDANAYRKIGLKRATTIAGLKDAPEQIVIDPDGGTPGKQTQYPNTFYGWGGYIWAQEFHKINGQWWIIAGMNRGYAPTNGWCDNTVLIPYTGTEESLRNGGLVKQENWGEPTILEGAAFDVSYLEREENGVTQGYWVMPNSAKLLIGKAKMGPKGTVPLIDGGLTEVYSISQPWEYGKQSPTPSDTNEGGDQGIVEAPYMVEHGEYIYLTYSGGTVDKYYDIGMLRAAKTADLKNPASWTLVPSPVLTTNDTFTGRIGGTGQGGTGHNSFATDPAGNLVLAYHARPYPEPHTGGAAGGLFDPDRNSWFKAVNVRANGMLDLSLTAAQEVAPGNRTVTARVVVAAAPAGVQASVATRCVAGKVTLVTTVTNTGTAARSGTITGAYGSTTFTDLGAGKSVSKTQSTRSASVDAGTVTVTVQGASTPVTTDHRATSCR
ncbi:LamG-like jellyroll fold domain-containing protein [Microbacterium sp. VKM Ac-2923]|uniref:LamG-like jellyroll fold domain-containing protein n=1 Tax=Microbacterium sp. VKM Ac-2923 TaxID=2929476 RepID=UPI001FB3CA36|nr:LamG-like jellyroll fold domain-containing protein [Microbacterium sp. VKM Ac-2923]MCJ1708896.1 family 43 glycosylhydrolase [Microbacterium sp. VKM Ac-2923]